MPWQTETSNPNTMKRILHVISSLQGQASNSIKLGQAIVEKALQKYPGSTVEEVRLVDQEIPHLSAAYLTTLFVPGAQPTEEGTAALQYSEATVQQLLSADIVVIGAPFYNFSIPSTLKTWIDFITRPGLTFRYTEQGPVGLVTGKKVYVAMASGGIYSEGPGKNNDFVAPYLKAFLGFLGMQDVTVFRAEGVKVPGVMEHALQKGIDSIRID